jgi:hypothetical protein
MIAEKENYVKGVYPAMHPLNFPCKGKNKRRRNAEGEGPA